MRSYDKTTIARARQLRKEMTPWERHLWYDFLRDYSPKFRRQAAIGAYIADFYCAKVRLVLELDGNGHCEATQESKDQERTSKLETMGFSVLRISNRDVDMNFSSVCQMIDFVVKKKLNSLD